MTLRNYTIEKLTMAAHLDKFSYDMRNSVKFRRALLLLNNDDIDEADDLEEALK